MNECKLKTKLASFFLSFPECVAFIKNNFNSFYVFNYVYVARCAYECWYLQRLEFLDPSETEDTGDMSCLSNLHKLIFIKVIYFYGPR